MEKFLQQFQDPLVYLLLAATVISFIAWAVEKSTSPQAAESTFDCISLCMILIIYSGIRPGSQVEQSVEALAK